MAGSDSNPVLPPRPVAPFVGRDVSAKACLRQSDSRERGSQEISNFSRVWRSDRLFMAAPALPPSSHRPLEVRPSSKGQDELTKVMQRQPRSFASLVSSSRLRPRFPPMNLSSRLVGTKDGKPSVSFSAAEVEAGAKRFEFSLVAKFTVGRPSISEIQKSFQANWKIAGRATISEIWDSRHVLIILDSEADATAALACPQRKIGRSLFRLFRWTVDYNPRKESKMTSAWIKLPGLPLPLYEKCFVDVMVSTFGRLLDVDERTKACNALRQLRACIEVDVTKPIPSEIWVNLPDNQGFWQPVVVETKLSYCSGCSRHGHVLAECRKRVISREKKNSQVLPDVPKIISKTDNGVVPVSKGSPDINLPKVKIGWVQKETHHCQLAQSVNKEKEDEWQIVTKKKKEKRVSSMGQSHQSLAKETSSSATFVAEAEDSNEEGTVHDPESLSIEHSLPSLVGQDFIPEQGVKEEVTVPVAALAWYINNLEKEILGIEGKMTTKSDSKVLEERKNKRKEKNDRLQRLKRSYAEAIKSALSLEIPSV